MRSSVGASPPSPYSLRASLAALPLLICLLSMAPCHSMAGIPKAMMQHRAHVDKAKLPDWCTDEPYLGAEDWTTMTRTSYLWKTYHSVWLHNQKSYAMLHVDNVMDPSIEDGLSPNTPCLRNPVLDVANFTRNLKTG